MKRTELKRHTPLKAKTGLTATRSTLTRKGLKRVSNKQAKINAQYAYQRDVFLGLHDRCEVEICRNESQHVHHRRGRTGANMLDESTWLAVCPECHTRIHAQPKWAYEQGYLLSRHTNTDSTEDNQ